MIDRRAMLCALLGAALTPASVRAQADRSALRAWLARHVSPIRTIDPADEDFTDLAPLAEAIGAARIVQLGEPSHGAGSSFSAKARLVKFLHRELGFDVVAWESGLYDLTNVQAALRAGEPPAAAAQRGLLRIWSASQECLPLFGYAQATAAGPRPLDMAGFDMQFTAEESPQRFAADLQTFMRPAGGEALARQAMAAFDRLNAYGLARARRFSELSREGRSGAAMGEAMAAWEIGQGSALRPVQGHLTDLERTVGSLRRLMAARRRNLVAAHGSQRMSFMRRALDNLVGFGGNLLDRHRADAASTGGPSVESENRRDALNAENVRWLAEEAYRDRKLIIWAHNAHIMNAYYGPDWSSLSLEARPGWMKPTGVFLAERYGQAVYTIGVTAYTGEDGFAAPMPASAIPPSSPGSIEAELHELGHPYAFIDLRGHRGDRRSPLNHPQRMRIPKYEEQEIPDPAAPYDGLLFIARMARAHRVAAS